ncbi:restriction endonuclease subunit S [Marinomonas hwangdonensis]|uniref:Restriction endonuclease subunit S n=1 Tax=Marinomonas hwangdonensis TaxID=1053647 RepID=A0A3M8Q8M2_9GAMM|nr:restriction endonuclease subunit S [Marinomonas hwangdonensis]RNF52335.1 restriction endonuclease subunit S [Marinomonas hwangdonensis]
MSSEFEYLPLCEITVNFDNKRKPVKAPDRKPGPYPYYGASGIVDYVDSYIFAGEYLLIAEDGENLRTRQLPFAFLAQGKFWVNNHAHIVTGNERALTRYLMYALLATDITPYITGAVMPKITKGNLNNITVPCPAISIQKQIVDVLSSLDDRIALLRETNATLEAIAQALFKSWFVDFDPVHANAGTQAPSLPAEIQALFPSRLVESPHGLIPEGWEVGAIKRCCERVESGGTPKRSVATYWDGDISWLSSGEVRNAIVLDTKEKITALGVSESSAKLWPAGTTVVAMYGATAGEVCILAKPSTANQACCGLIPKMHTKSFVFFCIRRERENLASKSSGSAQQNLNKGLVESHEIVIPPKQVLAEFENSIGSILEGWIENERKAETLAKLRDTLLPRLISGQLRLPEAEAALAEVV